MFKINKLFQSNLGRTTKLILNILYVSSIITFLFSLLCFTQLNIKGVLFDTLLIYSLLNSLNIVFFYFHHKILNTYLIASLLGFFTILIIATYSGGINSPALSFLVLFVFFGYLLKRSTGIIWFFITGITVIVYYILEKNSYNFINELNNTNITEFNVLFLVFSIVLLGGVFGKLMNKNIQDIKLAKQLIQNKNDEKTIMLKEIHHRVKNNLQVINSLLNIQSRSVKDEKIKSLFEETQRRVVTMARLHEKIYKSNDLKSIHVPNHLNHLVNDLVSSYQLNKKISIDINIDPVFMSIDTILPISLIVNELISNSLKHAFINKPKGELFLRLFKVNESDFRLIVGDNGGLKNIDILTNHSSSIGTRLVKSFVRQLGGVIQQINHDKGAVFEILFTSN